MWQNPNILEKLSAKRTTNDHVMMANDLDLVSNKQGCETNELLNEQFVKRSRENSICQNVCFVTTDLVSQQPVLVEFGCEFIQR